MWISLFAILLHVFCCDYHDDVIKWKHFRVTGPLCGRKPPIIGGFPSQRPMTRNFYVFLFAHKQTLEINRNAGDLRRHRTYYDFTVMCMDMGLSVYFVAWWHHQMETCSALLAFCAGNSSVTGEFPAQMPVTRIFDVCCLLWSAPELPVAQTMETLVIWNGTALTMTSL